MAKIATLKDKNGNATYPTTFSDYVYDDKGNSVKGKFDEWNLNAPVNSESSTDLLLTDMSDLDKNLELSKIEANVSYQDKTEGKQLFPAIVGKTYKSANGKITAKVTKNKINIYSSGGLNLNNNDNNNNDVMILGGNDRGSESDYETFDLLEAGKTYIFSCPSYSFIHIYFVCWSNGDKTTKQLDGHDHIITINENDKYRILIRPIYAYGFELNITPKIYLKDNPLTDYEYFTYGKETPNKDYPLDIYSTSKKIKIQSPNINKGITPLFETNLGSSYFIVEKDKNHIKVKVTDDTSVSFSGKYAYFGLKIKDLGITLKPNTNYTLVFKNLKNLNKIIINTNDFSKSLSTDMKFLNNGNYSYATIKTHKDISLLNDEHLFYMPIILAYNTEYSFDDIAIYEGDDYLTEIVPYVEPQTIEIPELYGVDKYRDYISVDRKNNKVELVRKCHKFSSKDYSKFNNISVYLSEEYKNKKLQLDLRHDNILCLNNTVVVPCTRFIGMKSCWNTTKTRVGGVEKARTDFSINFSDFGLTNNMTDTEKMNTMNEWLNNNPFEWIRVLIKPTTENITYTDLGQILLNTKTLDNYTKIYSDDINELKATITATYPINLKKYISNKLAKIKAVIGGE